MSPSTEVRRAVVDLVAALDRNDTEAVLAAMAPDVTFVLGLEDEPLHSREALRERVARWGAAGQVVEAVHAWDLEIRELGDDLATATHVLSIHVAGMALPLRQRETLVFARSAQDGRWLVVQGHCSPGPYEWAGGGGPGVRVASTRAPMAVAAS
jgi:uncharacterized protein (TIGR02246 family)